MIWLHGGSSPGSSWAMSLLSRADYNSNNSTVHTCIYKYINIYIYIHINIYTMYMKVFGWVEGEYGILFHPIP